MVLLPVRNVVRIHYSSNLRRGRTFILHPSQPQPTISAQQVISYSRPTARATFHRDFSSKSTVSTTSSSSSIAAVDSKKRNDDLDSESATANSAQYTKAALELSKARLSALVVSTTTFGYLAAAPTPFSYSTLVAASLGTGLCSSCASTLNQIYERDRDAKMKRTANRPLVKQDIIGVKGAYTLALTTGVTGGATLLLGTDPVTTTLGLGNIALYSGIYTYLKPRSTWNTWIGAFVGAIPPVMGYAAATNGNGIFDIEAFILGSTLFLWQFPHFFALSWMHRIDYARGGFKMISTETETSDIPHESKPICPEDETARLITNYTYYLSTIPIISTLTGVTSSMFAIEGFVLNGYALFVAKRFDKDRSNKNARSVFLTSLWYLPCWMMLFLLHSSKWRDGSEGKMQEQNIVQVLKQYMTNVRDVGREMCPHEILVFDKTSKNGDGNGIDSSQGEVSSLKCPISSAKEATEKIRNDNTNTRS